MAGNAVRLTRRQHRRVVEAVEHAEHTTGVEFCVYLGPTGEDSRAHAEAIFTDAGLHARPAILLLVAPEARRIELLTAPEVQNRLSDRTCADVVAEMTDLFVCPSKSGATSGGIAGGLVAGIRRLETAVGPGVRDPAMQDLPDLIEG